MVFAGTGVSNFNKQARRFDKLLCELAVLCVFILHTLSLVLSAPAARAVRALVQPLVAVEVPENADTCLRAHSSYAKKPGDNIAPNCVCLKTIVCGCPELIGFVIGAFLPCYLHQCPYFIFVYILIRVPLSYHPGIIQNVILTSRILEC